jgi:hypothetical protein
VTRLALDRGRDLNLDRNDCPASASASPTTARLLGEEGNHAWIAVERAGIGGSEERDVCDALVVVRLEQRKAGADSVLEPSPRRASSVGR